MTLYCCQNVVKSYDNFAKYSVNVIWGDLAMGHIVVCVNHSANCWQYYDATAAIYCVLTAAGPVFFV